MGRFGRTEEQNLLHLQSIMFNATHRIAEHQWGGGVGVGGLQSFWSEEQEARSK